MTNDNDLRTALTKLADEHDAQTGPYARILHTTELRTLLAAHPAPEESPFAPDAVASRLTKSATQGLVPVSDTRREDIINAINAAHWEVFEASDGNRSIRPLEPDSGDLAEAVLAVLPAPPVVDEAEALIEAHVAEFEASISRLEASIHDPNNTFGGREYDTAKLHGQRGAVYALRRLADEIAARLRGATRG